MTLAQRNLYFKGGIVLSFLCLIFLVVLAARMLPLYPELCGEALHRPEGALQALAARFFPVTPQAAFAALAAAVFYALCASMLTFFLFEKTQSPEILFFGLFAVSFAFEALRLLIPLQRMYAFPTVLLQAGSRFLFFGRFFGVVSLFVSAVYAAGIDAQKQGKVVIAMLIAILIVVLRIPLSGQSWDTSLTILSGYSSMFRFTEIALVAITVLSFLAASYIKETKEYLFVSLGAFLVSLGRALLAGADTWVIPALGLSMLIAGTWLITQRLRRVYLWL